MHVDSVIFDDNRNSTDYSAIIRAEICAAEISECRYRFEIQYAGPY